MEIEKEGLFALQYMIYGTDIWCDRIVHPMFSLSYILWRTQRNEQHCRFVREWWVL